jgi:hypothetical protein
VSIRDEQFLGARDGLREVRVVGRHDYPVKERGRINDVWLAECDTKSLNPSAGRFRRGKPSGGSKVKALVFQAM